MSTTGKKATERLDIIVVGAGVGGLAAAHCLGQAGHHVTVLEAAPAIVEAGAGIQVCPNLTKILIKWGLKDEMEQLFWNDAPELWTFINHQSGTQVGANDLKRIKREHGNPWFVAHRADLSSMLFKIAEPFMDLRLNSKVASIDASAPSVTLESGEILTADLIIGADGIHSIVRRAVLENQMPLSTTTGDMAFRILVPTQGFKDDPELQELIDNPRVNCWMGPQRHVIGYPIRGRTLYNMVMLGPDDGSMESWSAKGTVQEVRDSFEGWEPRLQKLISHFNPSSVLKSKLVICSPLKTWVHPGGRIALLGDACHPMLPYKAQGAATAIEDAAVLGNLFSRITDRSQIPFLLRAYQEIRFPRATVTQSGALAIRDLLHMEDGSKQKARDDKMRLVFKLEEMGLDHGGLLNDATPWSNREKIAESFGYDYDKAVDQWWTGHVYPNRAETPQLFRL